MGKKKKKTVGVLIPSDPIPNTCSLIDDVANHLQLIKDSKGLVIGCNAVLRALEKRTIDAVLLISRKASPALYHILRVCCKNTDTLFLQLQDANIICLNSKLRASSVYGVKIDVLEDKKILSDLIERIKNARKTLQCRRKSTCSTLWTSEMPPVPASNQDSEIPDANKFNFKTLLHKKHVMLNSKFIGKAESFISLDEYSASEIDFPNYMAISNKISVSIK